MSLSAFRSHSDFLASLLERGVLDAAKFSLIDVGCSGGISTFWDQFGTKLRAVGFDPLVSEIERLNSETRDRDVRYVAAWVGSGDRPLPPGVVIDSSPDRGPYSAFALSSASRAFEVTKSSITADVFNRGAELRFADRRLSVDEWLSENSFGRVDVIKCDVDGFDFEVFVGAHDLLSGPERPLALVTEAQLHEPRDRHGTAFGDLDRYLRDLGYRLFDIDVYRYSRADLPAPFAITLFAQTKTGQAVHCDALYMLDPVMDPRVFEDMVSAGDEDALLKLVVLYEAFGLPDCAAALLVCLRRAGIRPCGLDVGWALDLLVPDNPYGAETYDAYINAFDANPRLLFPIASLPAPDSSPPPPVTGESNALGLFDWTDDMVPGSGCSKLGSMIVSPKGHSGHICYGPYRTLPRGAYRGTIIFDILPGKAVSKPESVTLEAVCNEAVVSQTIRSNLVAGVNAVDVSFLVTEGSEPCHVQLRLSVDASSEQRMWRAFLEMVG